MNDRQPAPIIGYTYGDQAGIGPEVIELALASGELPDNARYIALGERISANPGIPTRRTAEAAFEHLELAAAALRDGRIDGVVTGPVSKNELHQAGFAWPGQTEFFADRMGVDRFAMCLSGDHLTVGLVTTHLGLADVPRHLTVRGIVSTGELLHQFCLARGVSEPRIAVAALNPHAGERGAFGPEDEEVTGPATEELQAKFGRAVFSGPCVPDTVYREAVSGRYDAVIAPYHDQGLIPLKLLDFDNAINITLGLPRPRISPDHGTAFGIAGRGEANPTSTIRAFQLAVRLASSPGR